MNDNEKKIRETGELAAAWYGDPFAGDDEDAVDIMHKNAPKSTERRSAPAQKAPEPDSDEWQLSMFESDTASAPKQSAKAPSGDGFAYPDAAQRPAATRPAQRPAAPNAHAGTRPVQRSANPNAPAGTRPAQRQVNPNAPAGTRPVQRSVNPNAPAGTRPVQRPANPNAPAGTRPVQRPANPNAPAGTRPAQRPANPNAPATTRSASGQPVRRAPNGAQTQGQRPVRQNGTVTTVGANGVRRQATPAAGEIKLAKPKSLRRDGLTVGCVIRRTLLVIFTVILFAAGVLLAVCNTLANGPSETARDKAVMSALQASATKWAPSLFLSDETVEQIKQNSTVVNTDVRPIGEVEDDPDSPEKPDRWESAVDGMYYETINGKTFKGYVLFIKDPSRVSVGIWDKSFSTTQRIFEVADKLGAVAAINGGEFPDNGVQTGTTPMGLTYVDGECVWDDGYRRTFFGFTKENKLFVGEGTTREEAEAMGIRDAVAFQNGNTLITNDGENVTYYYADSNTGVAQRTAIAQLADGTVIFLVTDGRTASSMGATKNDIIDVLAEYGAVTAGLLDGGSSSMLYYRDYYDIYGLDKTKLDEWQLMGLVNKYKAFTNPRRIPTFFIVK